MRRPSLALRSLILSATLVLAAGRPLHAQRRVQLDVTLPGGAPIVTATNLFADADMRDLVRSGFPASLRYRLELWRVGGLFNELEKRLDWEMIVQYDPTAQRYRVVRRQDDKVEDLGSFATLSSAQGVIERPVRAQLVPDRSGSKYYYNLALDIEAMSVSDMDQLERWLRGDGGGCRGAHADAADAGGGETPQREAKRELRELRGQAR